MEQLRANDETPVEFLVHEEADARKYVSTLVKVMKTTTSDARAQHFAVSRYGRKRGGGGDVDRRHEHIHMMKVCVGGRPPTDSIAARVLRQGDHTEEVETAHDALRCKSSGDFITARCILCDRRSVHAPSFVIPRRSSTADA